jgi:5'-deoxynucleotidase YfbR-like HD superfamily hydrolase
MKYFKKILEFQKLLKEFNLIYRDLASIHSKHDLDNDVEHSFRVAMLCWMIIEEYKLKLDLNKIIRYALVHDFVEVYAGDVSIYAKTGHDKKHEKEQKALKKLRKNFLNLKSIWDLIDSYEKKEDNESRFVYVIEKLEPILLVILSEEDHWIKRNINFDQFFVVKQKKIKDINTFAQNFNREIMDYLKRKKSKYFKNPNNVV